MTLSLFISSHSLANDKPVVKNANQAAQLVKSRHGGKVLKVNSSRGKGNTVYKVKLIKQNGKVVTFTVYANTGRVVEH
ncbi:PepSY domain-containing protein [Thalassotalea sp. LPB0316]|nr:PepSY domain-containing protein [Thalassotalea sp. LPB0316]